MMKTFCIDFIVDVTASNEKNLPWIYFLIKEVVEKFLQYKTEEFVFGITTLRGGSESSNGISFHNGEDFTENEKEFLAKLMDVKTSRGDAQAVEQIDEAMKISLGKFKKNKDYLGVPILITDCDEMPEGKKYFDYLEETPIFHLLGLCSTNLFFNMRFLNAQGVEQSLPHISVKDYGQLTDENVVDFIYQTILTRIAKETVGN